MARTHAYTPTRDINAAAQVNGQVGDKKTQSEPDSGLRMGAIYNFVSAWDCNKPTPVSIPVKRTPQDIR